MIELDDIQNVSGDAISLQNYLDNNFERVYDLFTQNKHSDLVASRKKIKSYISLNWIIIRELDLRKKSTLAFISLLLHISEELGLISPFRLLYEHIYNTDYNIGERLKAASLYLIKVETVDDYLLRYDAIYNHLKIASETEEDNTDKVLTTMVNYYAQVIHDFGEFNMDKVLELKAKFESSISESGFSFLNSYLIQDILNVDLGRFNDAYIQIHGLLDSYLGRYIVKPVSKQTFLIETGNDYCNLLATSECNYMAIRQISVNKYQLIQSDSTFISLGRGVAVLADEKQLYAYMYSYGNMHYKKLIEELPDEGKSK